jgi:hypothetical protein
MLKESAVKLAALHLAEETRVHTGAKENARPIRR